MIILYTDFTLQGPYVGQLKAAIYKQYSNAKIVDLMHDVPSFDVKHSACLLNSLIQYFPEDSVFCCVVDPGVGSARQAIVLKVAGQYFVGPDNGLFEYLLRSNDKLQAYKISWQPAQLSTTFHGRDIFAPIAANIAQGNFSGIESISLDSITCFDWANDLFEIIYIDAYGNLMTGITASGISKEAILELNGTKIQFAKTYTDMPTGKLCWYVNSNQLVEIALRGQSAANVYSSKIGDIVV
ncbi:hypothetical protein MNBD_GAMMA23-2576 [hydrothermal vent metagenome]|uniref:Adenosyl-chloride synthase n=1 Tax=hydrothermal vent metagenome TaxID=652676 RepID=A0A3B0ZPC2_9ZZZZ